MSKVRNRDFLNGRAEGFPFTDWHYDVKNSISLSIDLRAPSSSLKDSGIFSDIFDETFLSTKNPLRNKNLVEMIVSDHISMIFAVNLYKMSKLTIAELRLLSNDKFFQKNPDGSDYFIPDCITLSDITSRSSDLEYINFVISSPMKFVFGKSEYKKNRYAVMYLTEMLPEGEMLKRYINPSPSLVTGKKK